MPQTMTDFESYRQDPTSYYYSRHIMGGGPVYPGHGGSFYSTPGFAIGSQEMEVEQGSNQPRRRIAVACTRCRKRKIRCTGNTLSGDGCFKCMEANVGHECHYSRAGVKPVSSVELPVSNSLSAGHATPTISYIGQSASSSSQVASQSYQPIYQAPMQQYTSSYHSNSIAASSVLPRLSPYIPVGYPSSSVNSMYGGQDNLRPSTSTYQQPGYLEPDTRLAYSSLGPSTISNQIPSDRHLPNPIAHTYSNPNAYDPIHDRSQLLYPTQATANPQSSATSTHNMSIWGTEHSGMSTQQYSGSSVGSSGTAQSASSNSTDANQSLSGLPRSDSSSNLYSYGAATTSHRDSQDTASREHLLHSNGRHYQPLDHKILLLPQHTSGYEGVSQENQEGQHRTTLPRADRVY